MATDIIPISAEYLARGTLQYEFTTETHWSPIQLMKISDAQAQVRTYVILLFYLLWDESVNG